MDLSKHFTLKELTDSTVAERKGIANVPTTEQVENLKMVASVLEQIRELVGQPVKVSSGFRCPELNRAVGGSKASAHMQGLAADIHVDGMSAKQLALKIAEAGIVMDQLIYEGSWVHVGLSAELPRKQVLTALFLKAGTRYLEGIK